MGDGDGDINECQLTNDASELGNACEGNVDCGEGYTCHPFNGFVFVMECQILCEEDCQCPDGLTCQPMADNINQWMQCM